ncbi:hypothetical protein [Chitinophaga rhizosphaerae]|uniref:hypothetical protein n=1 Tax=Chitinophaga rhizosphaerae TaxID=1864947 RepID=UPI000F815D53|nr:hypothetical protein [Chitinophaga rhizosphaerae]
MNQHILIYGENAATQQHLLQMVLSPYRPRQIARVRSPKDWRSLCLEAQLTAETAVVVVEEATVQLISRMIYFEALETPSGEKITPRYIFKVVASISFTSPHILHKCLITQVMN